MLNLPAATVYNKRIPKQTLYEHLAVKPELKRVFIEQISAITWANKLAATTLNLAPGQTVTEVEVFEIQVNQQHLDMRVLQLIDRAIPYHVLYLLRHGGQVQAWIGYKQQSLTNAETYKVNAYYHTPWLAEDALALTLDGLNMDTVYEGFLRQIAGDALNAAAPGEDLQTAIERNTRRQKLQKQITQLETRVRNERQFNRQMELNAELKKLRIELIEL